MSGTISATWTKQLLGYRLADINVGDTPKTIALRELGDAKQWVALVAVNNLQPPYIVDSIAAVPATGGVLAAGGQIKIPAPAVQLTGVANENDAYGTDFLLTNGMLTADSGGDIQSVTGRPNLVQSLQHALVTRKKELIEHPTYGCDVFTLLGQGNGAVAMQLAGAYCGSTVQSDPRIASVANLVATSDGDAITVSADATPIAGKPLPVGATVGG